MFSHLFNKTQQNKRNGVAVAMLIIHYLGPDYASLLGLFTFCNCCCLLSLDCPACLCGFWARPCNLALDLFPLDNRCNVLASSRLPASSPFPPPFTLLFTVHPTTHIIFKRT